MIYFRKILIAILFVWPMISIAAIPAWEIKPKESSISFTATQNNAPVSGKFTTFSGLIHFDPNELSTSDVTITIDMNSVSTPYAEVAKTLKTAEWFNIATFPNAVFKANKFTKTGDKTYQAQGSLTIRDKTVPVVLTFTLENYSKTQALVKGSTDLKRLAFNVGQGEWSKTDAVKDEVKVDFILSAVSK